MPLLQEVPSPLSPAHLALQEARWLAPHQPDLACTILMELASVAADTPQEVHAAAVQLLQTFPRPPPSRPALGLRLTGSCSPCRHGAAPCASAASSVAGSTASSSGAAGRSCSVSAVSEGEFLGPAVEMGGGRVCSVSEAAMLAEVMWHAPSGDGTVLQVRLG